VALARDDDDVLRPRLAEGQADRRTTVGLDDVGAAALDRARDDLLDDRERVFGPGLSLVMTVRSAVDVAAVPIEGRFARSRSPPQPNTTMTRPAASERAPRSTDRMLSGVCA
jgi:hypothetical protein